MPSKRTRRTSATELEYQLAKVEAEIEGLKYYAESEGARRLVPLIKKTGAYKGEITDLTPAQYKKLLGRSPRASIVSKKTGKIPWHLAFDELASELGYRSDEHLRKAIEDVSRKLRQLDGLKHEKSLLSQDLKVARKTQRPKIWLMPHDAHVNGRFEVKGIRYKGQKLGTAVRIPSEWRIVWTENGIEPGAIESPLARTRYAKDLKKAVKEAFALNPRKKRKVKKPRRKS